MLHALGVLTDLPPALRSLRLARGARQLATHMRLRMIAIIRGTARWNTDAGTHGQSGNRTHSAGRTGRRHGIRSNYDLSTFCPPDACACAPQSANPSRVFISAHDLRASSQHRTLRPRAHAPRLHLRNPGDLLERGRVHGRAEDAEREREERLDHDLCAAA
jgi:hypothetical protein